MKLLVYSDLHNEFGTFEPPANNSEVVVLAGDTHTGSRGAHWALETFGDRHIVYLAGNHEYYSHEMTAVDGEIMHLAEGGRLHFLNPGQTVIDGVRFVGATLWTDFALFGHDLIEQAMARAHATMNDYRRIYVRHSDNTRPLIPADTQLLHRQARDYIERCLAVPFEGPTVVLSHHGPSLQSLPDFAQGQLFRAAYCSNLEALIRTYQPELWIHGHTHFFSNYRLGATRVICNPRGYARFDPVAGFIPDLCIEV